MHRDTYGASAKKDQKVAKSGKGEGAKTNLPPPPYSNIARIFPTLSAGPPHDQQRVDEHPRTAVEQ